MGDAFEADLARQFESVFEAMVDGVWVCDAGPEPRLLWINSACEKLNEIRREDVCGRTVEDLLASGNFDRDVTSLVLREGKPVAINQQVQSGRNLLVNGVPVFDDAGHIAYVVGCERDLTELNLLRQQVNENLELTNKLSAELLAMTMRDLKLGDIVAESEAMERVMETVLRVAVFDTTVLLTGPSGVGKSLIARVIHDGSSRREAPFLTLNCGALPPTLLEAELFGYEAGAFTGAEKGGKIGLLEAANRGTLFLDEIDSFPLAAQVKLLTFLDTQGFIRVGGTRIRDVDVRLIAATNQDLGALVRGGKFREDLWFRLNVVPIEIAPLKARRSDIPALIRNRLAWLSDRHDIERGITAAALDRLCRYGYPGNVRELHNILERSFVLSRTGQIDVPDLPEEVRGSDPDAASPEDATLRRAIAAVERQLLRRACRRHRRQIDIAAALGVSQPTVARLLRKHGLTPDSIQA